MGSPTLNYNSALNDEGTGHMQVSDRKRDLADILLFRETSAVILWQPIEILKQTVKL